MRARSMGAGLLALTLLAASCGDDDTVGSSEPTTLDLVVDADGLTGLPASFAGGAVEVHLTNDTGEDISLDFTRVDDGVTAAQFAADFGPVLEGGPFPDFVQSNAGVDTQGTEVTSTILLSAGHHIVWYESDDDGDEDTPSVLVSTEVTVTEGAASALSAATGEIVASDYAFSVDVDGPGTYVFRNEGPTQFHHAVIVDFGTNAADDVEKAFGPLLAADEGDVPPEAESLDMAQIDFDFGGSAVFGPGSAGTFEADFQSGTTYGVACFISDRAGGPPHAFAYDMFDVFTVD